MKDKLFLLLMAFLTPFCLFGQSHSWDGNGMKPNEKRHYLNIFVNIIYDVNPEYNDQFSNSAYWPPVTDPSLEGINTAAIPTYLLEWMDTVYIPGQLHGTCTRLFGESSFDSLQITGDFVVVNLCESTVLGYGSFNYYNIRNIVIDMLSHTNSFTLFGHRSLSDFNAQNIMIRNITKNYGGLNPGSGYGGISTLQCVGDGNFPANIINVVSHEISHSLFGSNKFHTSGGNHRDTGCKLPFLNVQCGYGLMGAGGTGIVSCNGYDRWRMHWKHPQSTDYISARDISGTQSVVSDISKESGNRNFILRDFVTYGDVIRIKLPYKDSITSSNQYIWLENHQVGSNGKLDFLKYSNTYPCRPAGSAGVYAYYQIGRDTLEGTDDQVWDDYHCDNLKIIPAEGYYDYELYEIAHQVNCVTYGEHNEAVIRGIANPFCGNQDQELPFFPRETDTLLYLSREFETWRKYIGAIEDNSLPQLGDTLDAFSTHTKINMGTNPSTCNAKTYHSTETRSGSFDTRYIVSTVPEKNVQTTYLTGLSIEMTPEEGTGNIQVSVRWDDYNITNDTRWTGKIVLKETAFLTAGKTITLAQNKTVAQPKRDPGTGLFAGRTRWTCEGGSFFRQDSASVLLLTENSSLVFEDGSRYELSKDARVEIQAGCSLTIEPGAQVLLKGTVEVDSGGVMVLYDTAKMDTLARLIVRPGGKLIVDGGTLTSACDGEMWQGIEVVGDRTKQQLPQYQGTVELLNGAVIENAWCGIRTGLRDDIVNFATTGGIILADSATFKNNRQSVVINSYSYTMPPDQILNYNATFSRCTLTVDNSTLFAANNTSFAEHVRLWDVKGVAFKGCIFSNSINNPYGNGRGIYADDAGLSMDTYCRVNYLLNCKCPTVHTDSCQFSGFNTAVEVNTSGNPYPVSANQVRFSGNGSGIRVNSNNFVTVTRCTFDQTTMPESANSNYGLYLNGCTGYKVEEDTFKRTTYPTGPLTIDNSTGIYVASSGIANNSLYRNIFEKLTKGIYVVGQNGLGQAGLCMTCNRFSQGKYDIYIAGRANVATMQRAGSKGADNTFAYTQNSSFYNLGLDTITYFYKNYSDPITPYRIIPSTKTTANSCSPTLCNNNDGNSPILLADFQSDMNTYTAALADDIYSPNPSNSPAVSPTGLADMRQSLSDTYHESVRALMSDSLLDLAALEQWHAAAQPIADPYSLTETRFMEGYNEPFTADADDAELANYAEFHAMKLSLRNNDGSVGANHHSPLQDGHINWYALTPAQIAQLQTIAERNTGRASEMAKGVLCFFFDICYDDDLAVGVFDTLQQVGDTSGVHTKRAAMDGEGVFDTPLRVWPNPTDDLLFVELRGGDIANLALYDLQGRVVGANNHSPLQGATATLNVKTVPAGVYVLRVTGADGKEYHQKIVKR